MVAPFLRDNAATLRGYCVGVAHGAFGVGQAQSRRGRLRVLGSYVILDSGKETSMKLLSRQVGVSAQDLWRALTVVGLITLFTLAVGCSPTPPQPKSDPLTQGSRHFAPPAGIGSGTGNTTSQPLDTSLNLIYHHGPVMHSVNAYLIFWAPPGVASCPTPTNCSSELLLIVAAAGIVRSNPTGIGH